MGLGSFLGGGLGFGVAFSLRDDFSRTSQQIQQQMERLGQSTDRLERQMNQSMNQMAVGAGLVAAGIAALMPLREGLRIAGEFEQAKVGLETFLGSAEAAQNVFENIKQDAKVSATFDTAGLLAVNRALISAGVSAEDARKDANNLANAIAAVGGGNDELSRMAVNMQQIKNVGKAEGLDIKQFAYAGINIYKLLQEETGKTVDQIKEMDITYDLLSKALERSAKAGGLYAGASERQANTINGALSNLEDNWAFAMAGIGEAVQGAFRGVVDMTSKLLSAFAEFTNSPFGKWVINTVVILGVLSIAIGGTMLAIGFMRIGVYKLAGAFSDNTKAMILTTIAQNGVTAGFKAMARAAWASLGPYVLIAVAIAALVAIFVKLNKMITSNSDKTRRWGYTILLLMGPIGWLVGGIMAISQGLKDFDGLMDGSKKKMTGIAGLFQKIGGILRGVVQIFNSWDAATGTFALTENVDKALGQLGIKDTVIALGTYIARFMNFMEGVAKGASWAFEKFSGWITSIMDKLSQTQEVLGSIGITVGKATSTFSKWHDVGETVGKALIIILGLVLAAIIAIGVVCAAIGAIFLVVGGIIGLVFYSIYKSIVGVIDVIKLMIDWIVKGVSLAASAGSKIASFFGFGGDDNNTTTSVSPMSPTPIMAPANNGRSSLDDLVKSRASAMSWSEPYVIDKTNTVVKNVNVTVPVDGDVIANKTIDVINQKDSRSNR